MGVCRTCGRAVPDYYLAHNGVCEDCLDRPSDAARYESTAKPIGKIRDDLRALNPSFKFLPLMPAAEQRLEPRMPARIAQRLGATEVGEPDPVQMIRGNAAAAKQLTAWARAKQMSTSEARALMLALSGEPTPRQAKRAGLTVEKLRLFRHRALARLSATERSRLRAAFRAARRPFREKRPTIVQASVVSLIV